MVKTSRKRRKIQGVTMADVAQVAGVSSSTVSLYLRRPSAVSSITGDQIAAAIARLDYVPNVMAGGLAGAVSRTVGVIVPSLRNAFFAQTVSALQEALAPARLQLLLGHSEYSLLQEENLVRTNLSWSPAALVITGLKHSAGTESLLRDSKVPVIEMWELGEKPPVYMAVGFDHRLVGQEMARHLHSRGRRPLVFFSARLHEDHRAAQRVQGFMAQAQKCGVPAFHIDYPDVASTEAGVVLLRQWLLQNPDARQAGIACSNDHMALGVIFEAQRQGIAIPQDVAVMGFGDLGFASSCNPALSTIRPSGELIGREVARLIIDHMENGPVIQNQIVDTGFMLLHRHSS